MVRKIIPDIVNYQDFCMAGQWLVDLMRASLLFQIDVNECVWGLVGSITSDTQDCDWATYYINQPFLDYKLLDGFGGELYNIKDEIWQRTDLAGKEPKRFAKMMERMKPHYGDVQPSKFDPSQMDGPYPEDWGNAAIDDLK